jgi:hypothetical protein|tara:strand:- start:4266 stop:4532 length:267 start_codon:yes stop_codon:yes gene_type:complete
MFGKFSVIRDEEGSQVALLAPSPIMVFDTLKELKEWLEELTSVVSDMEEENLKSSVNEKPLNQRYASQVIEEWQTLLQKTRKNNGTEQ